MIFICWRLWEQDLAKNIPNNWFVALSAERSRICRPKKISLCIRIILGWLFLRSSRHKKSSENWVLVILLKEKFIFMKEISIPKDISLSVLRRTRMMTKICRNSYKGEGNNLNFHDNLTHGLGPHQEKTSFFFNWRWYFKVVAWFFSRSYSVFWLFPLCTRNLHIIKLLFIFISGRIQPRT